MSVQQPIVVPFALVEQAGWNRPSNRLISVANGATLTVCRSALPVDAILALEVIDRIDMAGVQVIGWDPAAKQIRSWVFDSDGGFAEGRWTKKDKRWYITTSGTLHDGSKATSVNVITHVDDNRFKWQSVNRTAGGELLPNIDEVLVVRSQAAK